MAGGAHGCAFCGASSALVPIGVLDDKWCKRFGGGAVMALDHGWYTSLGHRLVAASLDRGRTFDAHVRVLCDFCRHGWVEDVRWRAEPVLLSIAERRSEQVSTDQLATLVRWAELTALLAEHVEGMPRASSFAQRYAVRRDIVVTPPLSSWFYEVRQRLPARVHLSQIPVSVLSGGETAFVQVVSVDLAHLSVLVVLPSHDVALAVVDRSKVAADLGATSSLRSLDLSRSPHPHKVAVQRLCSANSTGRA